jgi:hypothetical protein
MAKDVPHVRGKMDIRDHQRTYDGFWSVTVWTTILLIISMILMAIFLV